MRGQLDDVVRRPGPEHDAVSGIYEAGLELRVLQPEQERVDENFLELRGDELSPLLIVPGLPMSGIEGLYLSLLRKSVLV